MALSVKVGSFVLNGSTGNQAVTGVGFQPSLVLFYASALTSDTDQTVWDRVCGAITATQQMAQSTYCNTAGSSSVESINLSRCLDFSAYLDYATFVSMDADGFTINIGHVTTVGGAIVNYVAFGGTDVTNVKIKEFQSPASSGSQAYTGVGFQPTAGIMIAPFGYQASAAPWSTSEFGWSYGFWTEAASIAAGGAGYSGNTESVQKTSKAITNSEGLGGIRNQASLTSFDSDGFTLNWDTVTDSNNTYYYVVLLKGPQFKVGTFNQATSTGNQAVTGVGFQPSLVLFTSNGFAATTSIQTVCRHAIGAAESASSRFMMWSGKAAPLSGGLANSVLNRSKVLEHYTEVAGSPTLVTSADFVSMDADGFTVNNGTVDATAREIGYFAIGAAASAGGGTGHKLLTTLGVG